MPMRVMRSVLQHIDAHPRRLLVTMFALICISWGLATYAVTRTFDQAHQGRVENCRAINELSRKLYVTFSDWQFEPAIVMKFLPTTDCENLP